MQTSANPDSGNDCMCLASFKIILIRSSKSNQPASLPRQSKQQLGSASVLNVDLVVSIKMFDICWTKSAGQKAQTNQTAKAFWRHVASFPPDREPKPKNN